MENVFKSYDEKLKLKSCKKRKRHELKKKVRGTNLERYGEFGPRALMQIREKDLSF